MLVRVGTALLLVMFMLVGCDDGDAPAVADSAPIDAAVSDVMVSVDAISPEPDSAAVDAGPPLDSQPPPSDAAPADAMMTPALTVDPERSAEPERLSEEAVSAAFPLADDVVLAQVGETLHWFTRDEDVPLLGVHGALRGAVGLGDETVVATENGLFAVRDTGLVASPLDEYLSGVWTVVGTASDTAWFLGDDGIRVWQTGRLHEFALDEAPEDWMNVLTAAGAYNGRDALWLAVDDAIYALAFDAAAPAAWTVEPGGMVGAMTATAGGLWITLDGDLAHLDTDDNWHLWTLPFTVESLSGHADAPDVWMKTDLGLVQLREGRARSISDAPAFTGMTTAADGSAILWGESGLHRIRPGRFVRLVGLDEGAIIRSDMTISVEATSPETVTLVEYAFDDGDANSVDGPPWSFDLSPRTLGAGRHAVGVTVRYADDAVVTVSAHFEVVGPPTWVADIEPLFVEHCDQCHGPRRYAHRMETMEVWMDEVADIIDSVEAGRMPLTPNPLLTDDQIQLIRDWQAAAFPETWP